MKNQNFYWLSQRDSLVSKSDIENSGILATASQIGLCQPEAKLNGDTTAAKLFYRRAGYYAGAALWRVFRLRPNSISLLSGALAILSLLLTLFFPSIWLVSVLLIVVAILDCADGALARYLQQASPKGELADAIGGYIVLWCVPFITWLMAFAPGERLSQTSLLVGLVTSIIVAFHYLGRSIHQKMAFSDDSAGGALPSRRAILVKRVQGDLSFCGFMFPVFIVCWYMGWPLAAWLYSICFLSLVGLVGLASGVKHAAT